MDFCIDVLSCDGMFSKINYWQCYEVEWDDGEVACLSPWEMEPIPPNSSGNGLGSNDDIIHDGWQCT